MPAETWDTIFYGQLQERPDLIDVFKGVSGTLSHWTVWHGENILTPILFIARLNQFSDVEVYDICGSSMYLLLELYHSYMAGGIHPSSSFYAYHTRLNLIEAMSPDNPFH